MSEYLNTPNLKCPEFLWGWLPLSIINQILLFLNIAMAMAHRNRWFPIYKPPFMVGIFHGYVKWPNGKWQKVTLLGTGTHHRRLHEFMFQLVRRNQLKGLVDRRAANMFTSMLITVHMNTMCSYVCTYLYHIGMSMYIYIHIYIYIHCYICTEREREKGQKPEHLKSYKSSNL